MRSLFARLRRAARQPLLASQVASSASGALAVVLAGAIMIPGEFLTFTLLNLIATTLVGLIRACLFQPALIQQRRDPSALVPLRYAAIGSAAAGALLAAAGFVLGVDDPTALLLLAASGIPPILHDWLRFRSIASSHRWRAAVADFSRLALVPVVLLLPSTAISFQAWLGLSLLIPVVGIAFATDRIRSWAPYSSYRRPALLQLADFVVGQFGSTAPLLVLGAVGTSTLIAGVRFAQTLLGPLNLAFAASTTGLIADAATSSTHASEAHLIRRGRQLGLRLIGLAGGVVTALVLVVWATGFSLRGVGNEQILFGLVLIGVSTVTSGWAGIHAILLRLIHRHSVATLGRVALVLATTAGFVLGYLLGGIESSLIVGFATSAVAAPLALAVPALIIFRRREA